jgi:hypothetical protein
MITCLGKIARAKLSMMACVHVGVAGHHVVDGQGDTAPQDAKLGKR